MCRFDREGELQAKSLFSRECLDNVGQRSAEPVLFCAVCLNKCGDVSAEVLTRLILDLEEVT